MPRPTREARRGREKLFAYGAFTLCGLLFQHSSAKLFLCDFPVRLRTDQCALPQPATSHIGPQALAREIRV